MDQSDRRRVINVEGTEADVRYDKKGEGLDNKLCETKQREKKENSWVSTHNNF